MLALQKQSKYIKRTIQLPNGDFAIVVFELVEINGKIIAKAVYGQILKDNVFSQEEFLALPVYFERKNIEPVVSPFFTNTTHLLKDLSFVISQPTRAPNFK